MKTLNLSKYKKDLRHFAKKRDWDKFHNPKNLSMALGSEVGELLDIFQWLTEEDSKKENLNEQTYSLIKEEIADIQIYIIRLADKLGIDLSKAIEAKLKINALKYPIKLAKGNAVKYNRR